MRAKLGLFTLISLMLLFISWVVDVLDTERAPWVAILIEALRTLGSTGLAVAALNFWIEAEDWRRYFEERIKSVVVQQDYMKGLDVPTLNNALRNLMKARFRDAAVDKDDAFLKHFEDNILEYIGSPFREDVTAIVAYEPHDDDTWAVTDRVEYVCRRLGSTIQKKIEWDAGEGCSVQEVEVAVSLPNDSNYSNPEILISSAIDLDALPRLKAGIALAKYSEIDRLKVTITSKYLKSKTTYYAWCMAHPSRNVDVQITFPVGFVVTNDVFFAKGRAVEPRQGSSYFRIVYKGWVLPENGLVWQIGALVDNKQQETTPLAG
jgi:hypothetical protein